MRDAGCHSRDATISRQINDDYGLCSGVIESKIVTIAEWLLTVRLHAEHRMPRIGRTGMIPIPFGSNARLQLGKLSVLSGAHLCLGRQNDRKRDQREREESLPAPMSNRHKPDLCANGGAEGLSIMKLLQFLRELFPFVGNSLEKKCRYFLATRYIVWFFVAVLISSCIRIYPMYASIVDNQVVFIFDRWAGDDVTYRLNGIEVTRIDCNSNCTMWQMGPKAYA